MRETKKNYKVIREYQGLYDTEELVRRIIRHHIQKAFEKKELPQDRPGER